MSPPRLAKALRSPAWRALLEDALAAPSFEALEEWLEAEHAAGLEVLPPRDEVFAALEAVAPDDVRLVILGQDPYPTPGHAHGLAFSYRGGGALPRSLVNVFREIERDLGVSLAGHSGELGAWARQGVLLLNTALTVRAGEAGSHRRRGWEAFTDAVLTRLADREQPIVFLLWGNDARKKKRLLGDRHPVLEAGHPSPLSVRHFRGCAHFSRANELIAGDPILWHAD